MTEFPVPYLSEIADLQRDVRIRYEWAQAHNEEDLADYLGEALDALGNAVDMLEARRWA